MDFLNSIALCKLVDSYSLKTFRNLLLYKNFSCSLLPKIKGSSEKELLIHFNGNLAHVTQSHTGLVDNHNFHIAIKNGNMEKIDVN